MTPTMPPGEKDLYDFSKKKSKDYARPSYPLKYRAVQQTLAIFFPNIALKTKNNGG